MTDEDLFIVRAKTKRGRIVYFLANFKSLIEHKHVKTVQYLNKDTNDWIEFDDITNGMTLATDLDSFKFKLTELNTSIFYSFQVHFDIYDKRKLILSKDSRGSPIEYYGYLFNLLYRQKLDIEKLSFKVKLIDFEDWYTSRQKNTKRNYQERSNFTIIHI